MLNSRLLDAEFFRLHCVASPEDREDRIHNWKWQKNDHKADSEKEPEPEPCPKRQKMDHKAELDKAFEEIKEWKEELDRNVQVNGTIGCMDRKANLDKAIEEVKEWKEKLDRSVQVIGTTDWKMPKEQYSRGSDLIIIARGRALLVKEALLEAMEKSEASADIDQRAVLNRVGCHVAIKLDKAVLEPWLPVLNRAMDAMWQCYDPDVTIKPCGCCG